MPDKIYCHKQAAKSSPPQAKIKHPPDCSSARDTLSYIANKEAVT